MSTVTNLYRRFLAWFVAARQTEKISAITIILVAICFAIYLPITALNDFISDTKAKAETRREELVQVNKLLSDYKELNSRLDTLKATFDKSSMTFEEVTTAIDEIVRQSIGSDNYSLQKKTNPSQLGFDYEKQDFDIVIRQATLEQVVKLLHSIEQGNRPLFLGNIILTKAMQKDEFTASLTLYSIRKS